MKSTKNYILTVLSYVIPAMILGYVWYDVIFKGVYDSLKIYNRSKPIGPLIFSSIILQGVIIAYFYPIYAKGNSTIKKAIVFSLILGLFLFSVSTLANAAKIEVTSMSKWLLIQIAFHLLQFTLAGVLIGLVNRQKTT